jgi:hypothetical protein
MNETERASWVELATQDPTATSTRFVLDLNWLDAARYVFDRNYVDAIRIPDSIERNVGFILEATRQQEATVHREFVRRFHNYLAAAKTMVDHTRAVHKRWGTDEFSQRWTEMVKLAAGQPVVKFVQEMRNAMHHSQLPQIDRIMTFEPIPPGPNTVNPRLRLMVGVNALREMRDWSQVARKYIEQAADRDDVDMTVTVKEYHHVADGLHSWFVEEIKKDRKDLLEDFDTRRSELARLSSL